MHLFKLSSNLPLDKIAAISQTIFSNAFPEWKCLNFDSLKFVPNSMVYQHMFDKRLFSWHKYNTQYVETGDKPFPEPTLTLFISSALT